MPMPVDAAALSIVHFPHPILRKRAMPVETIDAEVKAVAMRMIELMIEAEGAGLAAPQVGLPWRLFVTLDPEERERGLIWINPVLELDKSE